MKKQTILSAIICIISSCSSSPKGLESRVQSFMKDSVVTSFNDPKSYEWVSMNKPDSIFIHAVAKEALDKDSSDIKSENRKFEIDKLEFTNAPEDADYVKKITEAHNHILLILNESMTRHQGYLSRPDSLININIVVNCRAKNAMGALILNTINLQLNPKDNVLKVVQ